jgi:hypothetical protein
MDASVSTRHRDTLHPIASRCALVFAKDLGLQDAQDPEVIKYCGDNRYVFVTEDKRIRTNRIYVQAIQDAAIGFVEVRFRKATLRHKDDVYKRYLESLCELARHPFPFCVAMNGDGLRFTVLGDHSDEE